MLTESNALTAASRTTRSVGRATASSAVTIPSSAVGPVVAASTRPGRAFIDVSSRKEVESLADQALDEMQNRVAGHDLVEHPAEPAGCHGADGVLRRRHAEVSACAEPGQESHAFSSFCRKPPAPPRPVLGCTDDPTERLLVGASAPALWRPTTRRVLWTPTSSGEQPEGERDDAHEHEGRQEAQPERKH